MGMSQLEQLISEKCRRTVTENNERDFSLYAGKTIAFDASDGMYPFLEQIRQQGPQLLSDCKRMNSHLSGALLTTVRLLENEIKPVYVFSGNSSPLKAQHLLTYYKRQEEKKYVHGRPKNAVDPEVMNKFYRRLAMIGKRSENECKQLFNLMGIPFVVAPGEAAAQCAEMVRAGRVYATISDDINALTFGSNVLLNHIIFPPYPELPIEEFHLHKILAALELNQSEFIDLSILLGCKYCDGIRGMGRREVLRLVQRHHNIEKVLENDEKKRLIIPENWKYKEVRELFTNPEVTECKKFKLKWTEPDVEGIVQYLAGAHDLDEKGIRKALKKI